MLRIENVVSSRYEWVNSQNIENEYFLCDAYAWALENLFSKLLVEKKSGSSGPQTDLEAARGNSGQDKNSEIVIPEGISPSLVSTSPIGKDSMDYEGSRAVRGHEIDKKSSDVTRLNVQVQKYMNVDFSVTGQYKLHNS